MKAILIILILAFIAIQVAIAFVLIVYLLTRDKFFEEHEEQVARAYERYIEETKKQKQKAIRDLQP